MPGEKEEKPEEELDFDELDKALGIDENLELEELPNITEEKSVIKGTDDIGLSELEKALDKDEFPDSGKKSEARLLIGQSYFHQGKHGTKNRLFADEK